jgi:hypothetical protein
MGHRFDPYMAFSTNHLFSLVDFLLLSYDYNVLRKLSVKIKKHIKKKYEVSSRHMRVARYQYLLCRSILGTKRWRTVRKKHRRKRNMPPSATWTSFFSYSKNKMQHYWEAGSRIGATKRLLNHNKKGGVSSLSGLFIRVYNVRTRRFRVGRRFCFRSNILTPLLYIPYYVSSSSNLYGTLSNHYITLFTKFLVKHIRRYNNKKRKSKVLRRVKQFFLLYYKAISFIRSTIRSRRSCYMLGFRNAYFSMCGLGGSFYIQNRDKYTYFKLLKDSKFLIKNTTGHVCVLNNVMSNSRSFI